MFAFVINHDFLVIFNGDRHFHKEHDKLFFHIFMIFIKEIMRQQRFRSLLKAIAKR